LRVLTLRSLQLISERFARGGEVDITRGNLAEGLSGALLSKLEKGANTLLAAKVEVQVAARVLGLIFRTTRIGL